MEEELVMIKKKINNMNQDESAEIIQWFDKVSENAGLVQTQTLRRIIELNYETEYLSKWFGGIDVHEMEPSSLESLYRSLVPLTSHADIEPYIQRIADEDSSHVLTQEPITTLSLSSGTTDGRQKYVPFTRHSSQTTLQIFRLAAAFRSRVYPIRAGGRVLEFIYSSKLFKTKGGLKAGTATSHYFSSEEFKIKQKITKSFTCSPQEVISGGDYKQSTYCHILLGLVYCDDVEFITSTFSYSLVQAFTAFEEVWEDICEDIREGTLSSTRVTIPKMRKAVLDIISPNPDLASRIGEKCRELELANWVRLIPKLWPNAKYLYSISTGSMEPYVKKLRHYAGDLPIVCADYGSTESWIGVNVDPSYPPEKVTFAVVPTFSYFEFIPLYRQKKDRTSVIDDFIEEEPVPLSQVKIGQEYEVVLTTFTGCSIAGLFLLNHLKPYIQFFGRSAFAYAYSDGSVQHFLEFLQTPLYASNGRYSFGLYRYRLGDVVEVAGFYNGTPKLNFLSRRKLILTVNIDKNTEKDLQLVVERGSLVLNQAKAELVDFTSHADTAKQPGHYVIYWEIDGIVNDGVLEECCREMDAAFVDHGYVVSRKMNSIGPLELCIVERGTFKKILDYFVGNGAAMSQFKTPRCTSNQVLLKILHMCTIKRFRSTAYGG